MPSACPGGWLDLDDMFLTARTLTRYVAELVGLIAAAVTQLPDEMLDRDRLSEDVVHPDLAALVAAFSKRVPWIGASMCQEIDRQSESSPRSNGHSRHDHFEHPSSNSAAEAAPSRLLVAITALDIVLTVHLKDLVSDLHRTMYQAFVRMCAAYVRWKRAFASEREQLLQKEQEEVRQVRRVSVMQQSASSLGAFTRDRKKSVNKAASRRSTTTVLDPGAASLRSLSSDSRSNSKGRRHSKDPTAIGTRISGISAGRGSESSQTEFPAPPVSSSKSAPASGFQDMD